MPITSSAKKALRQSVRHRKRNLLRKKNLSNAIKKYKKLISESSSEEAKKMLPLVYKAIDKTAKVGFIKDNKANRLKSQLAKKSNQVKS